MGGKLNVYGLGSLGVNVDKNPINLEDGELTKAQNAIHDPVGSMGGLRKRPGLTKVNSSAVSGSVFGIINVPIEPITTRTFYVGVDQSVTVTHQWVVSSNAFSTTTTSTSPAAIANPSTEKMVTATWNQLMTSKGLQTETLLFYPGAYTVGSSRPIRTWDFAVDRELFRIPTLNVAGVTATAAQITSSKSAIRQILQVDVLQPVDSDSSATKVNRLLFFVVHDFYHSGATFLNISFILQYNMGTGEVKQIGQAAAGYGAASDLGDGGVAFTCIAYHGGYLYAGVGTVDGANSTDAGIYRIKPGVDTTWTIDYTGSTNEVPLSLVTYKGLLYAGFTDLDAAAAPLKVRSATGTWANSTTIGGATTNNMWTVLKVFGANLYACSRENAGASSVGRIHKFDGTSWSIVKTIETAADPKTGVEMIVNNGTLFVLCKAIDNDAQVSYSSDGSSWTDQTSGLTNLDIACVFSVLTD